MLGHYVREEKVLSLENAVKKMSFDAARQFGLTNRGVIKEGAWADLVLFDDQTINDLATYTAHLPRGHPLCHRQWGHSHQSRSAHQHLTWKGTVTIESNRTEFFQIRRTL